MRPTLRVHAGTRAVAIAAALALLGCRSTSLAPGAAARELGLEEPAREFRAAWVATVSNIDWPSRPGLPQDEQRAEALAILDRLAELRFNAVVFQVRPHCDALYPSELEPWSAYLAGAEGRAPSPLWDPLAFWVDEAHARGLQLHAWFNPYRAAHPGRPGPPAESSVLVQAPELCVTLGTKGYRWLDPSLPEVQDHSAAVVLDVVRRYDVDGVHFDDYFYPYPSYAEGEDFPDAASWERYRAAGGTLDRGAWRRDAVDRFIRRIGDEVHAARPDVLFSVSPFGIWRPGHPRGIQGFDPYEALHADARRWLREGWTDALIPQLYWPIGQVAQSFPVLLGWWRGENAAGRHVWAGTSVARMKGEAGATELVNQVMVTRGMDPEAPGLCLFSARWLLGPDNALAEALASGPYAFPALPPASPWLDDRPPPAPALRLDDVGSLRAATPSGPSLWLVDEERGGRWRQRIVPGGPLELTLAPGWTRVAVRAVDRAGNVGPPALLGATDG